MSEEDKLLRQFREAADRFKVQKQLETLPTEQRIIARLKSYMQEWKDDLDARPQAAVNTTIGLQVWLLRLVLLPPVSHHAACPSWRCHLTKDLFRNVMCPDCVTILPSLLATMLVLAACSI